ncbi:MAG: pyruvate kinase [Halobaculum sp.]
MRRAKIVCTLGPASDDRETIRALIDAGMSVARLNASHGTPADRAAVVDRVREVARETDRPVATMIDVPGPEVRTVLADPLELAAGDDLLLVPVEDSGTDAPPERGASDDGDATDERTPAVGSTHEGARVVGVTASLAAAAPGDRVSFDDGSIDTAVTETVGDRVRVTVESGGRLGDGRGVNVPGVDLGLPVVSEADRAELQLAAEKEVAYVAASFVGSAADVDRVTEAVESFGGEVPVIAKIERAQALENLGEILQAADGVMIARGDLGVECPLERVPLIQKRIVREALDAGVPSIIATELLDSMIESNRPTRAEASDVANAVLDGTDAVMLSGETAVGDDPVRAVETMDRIVRDVERDPEYDDHRERHVPDETATQTDALARSARYLARDVGATAIAAATESGFTAQRVAAYRPTVPVVAVTPSESVRRRLALVWGVRPCYRAFADGDAASVIEGAATAVVDAGTATGGDTIVVLSGMLSGVSGPSTTNTLKLHLAAEVVARGRGVTGGRATGAVHVASGTGSVESEGGILVLPRSFDGEITGDRTALAGIVAADRSLTGYPAILARELGVPMVGGVEPDLADGTTVTVDGKRGVVYRPE